MSNKDKIDWYSIPERDGPAFRPSCSNDRADHVSASFTPEEFDFNDDYDSSEDGGYDYGD